MNEELVLVTGGSGFVGAHCIDQLLRAGYRVRTTVRNLKREPDVRAMLTVAGSPRQDALSFVAADLNADAGWNEAVDGCRFVLHVASPFPMSTPKDENDLIIPAREGTLRVLRAARDAGVERVVLTSSTAAVSYGHTSHPAPFDETDWTDLNGRPVPAYQKSKTLAERAAWDFIAREGRGLELSVINPVGIFGPALGPDYAASVTIVQRFLDGAVPVCPRINIEAVDVRDVADLHLRAMTSPAANGERFLANAGDTISLIGIAKLLKQRMGPIARRVPTRTLPDWFVRLMANFIPELKLVIPELGQHKVLTNTKARRVLGWNPCSTEDCLIATAESLQRLGLLKA
jgi:nucleoside-diphosphate-sugar epimerase